MLVVDEGEEKKRREEGERGAWKMSEGKGLETRGRERGVSSGGEEKKLIYVDVRGRWTKKRGR